MKLFLTSLTCAAAIAVLTAQNAPAPPAPLPAPQSQSDIDFKIVGDNGAPLHYAVPDFVALTADAETTAAAKLMAEVLFNDLAFEREFDLIPRDTYRTIPVAKTAADIPFERWSELNADGVVFATVQRSGNTFHVEMRLFNVRSRQIALGKQYDGIRLANPRAGAHAIADDIHEQRGLHGVARTRLAFASDRDNERMSDTVEKRDSKNIYVADYDGANTVRITTTPGQLNISPNWSPDGRSVVYTRDGCVLPQIIVSNLYLGTRDTLTDDKSQAFLPAFSPDGTKIAFMSDRDGRGMDIYVMNRDGSGVRRLTTSGEPNSTPTWSPTGTQIAFTSGRSGAPQIWVMDTDGLNVRRLTFSDSGADRATWSPAPFNEIAYSAQNGPGIDIRIYDVATGQTRQLTNGEGSNESPAFAPNGRHLAFTSTRAGKIQIYSIARDGKQLTKLTSAGNNTFPNWSR